VLSFGQRSQRYTRRSAHAAMEDKGKRRCCWDPVYLDRLVGGTIFGTSSIFHKRQDVSPDKCLWNPFAVHAGDGPCRWKTRARAHTQRRTGVQSQKTHTAVFVSVDKTVLRDREKLGGVGCGGGHSETKRDWGGWEGERWTDRLDVESNGRRQRAVRESAPHRLIKSPPAQFHRKH